MTRPVRRRRKLTRCGRTGLVIILDEIEAKLVLATRQARDRGETGYFRCVDHYHLRATDGNEEIAAASPA